MVRVIIAVLVVVVSLAMGSYFLFVSLPERNARQVAEEMIASVMLDPSSVQFRGVWVKRTGAVCGEVNAKNRMGGYVGFSSFAVSGDGRGYIHPGDSPDPPFTAGRSAQEGVESIQKYLADMTARIDVMRRIASTCDRADPDSIYEDPRRADFQTKNTSKDLEAASSVVADRFANRCERVWGFEHKRFSERTLLQCVIGEASEFWIVDVDARRGYGPLELRSFSFDFWKVED